MQFGDNKKLNLPQKLSNDEVFNSIFYILFLKSSFEAKHGKESLDPLKWLQFSQKTENFIRKYFQYSILQNSEKMESICLMCGLKKGKKDGIWTLCDFCLRWTHNECLEQSIDKTEKYKCMQCESNNINTPF